MNKLKPIFAMIKKYHVWVLCLAIIGTAVGGLFAASGGLGKTAKKTESEVKSLLSKANSLASKQNPPNQEFLDQIDEEIEAERARMRGIWKKIYERQQDKLPWPKDVGDDFWEKADEQAGRTRMETKQVEQFQDYASKVFDKLLGIVRAELDVVQVVEDDAAKGTKKPEKTTRRGVRSGYLVGWAPESQQLIRDPLVRWNSDRDFGSPSAKRAKDTQKQLWIYETMLNAIAATNQGATANYMAPVKRIRSLQVGIKTEKNPNGVTPLMVRVAAPSAKPTTKPRAVTPSRSKFHGIESIPVRMDLVVDQRHLARLLAECSNAPLPIEVTGFTARYWSRSGKDYFDQQAREQDGNGVKKENDIIGTIVDTQNMEVTIEGKINFYKPPDKSLDAKPEK